LDGDVWWVACCSVVRLDFDEEPASWAKVFASTVNTSRVCTRMRRIFRLWYRRWLVRDFRFGGWIFESGCFRPSGAFRHCCIFSQRWRAGL